QAGRKVVDDSEPLLAASQKLADAYEQGLGERTTNFIVLGFLILAAIAVISLIVLVYLGDTRRRAEEAERQRAETERTNQSNQDAILRRSEEHTSELQSPYDLVCRLLLEKKKIR